MIKLKIKKIIDGVNEESLLNFVIKKHLEYLVECDSRNRISQIVPRSANGSIEDNETIKQALLSPSDLFVQLLANSESVINESHVYEQLDLDYVTRFESHGTVTLNPYP